MAYVGNDPGAPFLDPASLVYDSDIGVTVQAYDADIATVAASQAEMEAGTEAALRSMSPLRVAQAISAQSGIVLGTPTASTSGTSIDFTGIPAGTRRMTIMLAGVSVNANSPIMFQLGDSGGVETSGYTGCAVQLATPNLVTATALSAGFQMQSADAANAFTGKIIFDLEDSSDNTWVATALFSKDASSAHDQIAGRKALSAVLDRVRITSVSGTAVFDAGEINISYES